MLSLFLEFPKVQSQSPKEDYYFVAIFHYGVLRMLLLNKNYFTRVGCPPESPSMALNLFPQLQIHPKYQDFANHSKHCKESAISDTQRGVLLKESLIA